ncbi:helix-turn-helix domain-containing protein [Sphaerisporangium fuscum]|uniref:helix-turn-helix domain-containing protein n=1 Tax=Sphaerisporangium fuscum TaxID=2835868 RepID=UPI002029A19F|nr:helix-turn-helix domain-containing protein [Sphaerisporangium fuscum]
MSDTWTIGELAERAADTLGPSSPRPNGRVRDVPNERLIRWYTTIGLLDPPLTRRGRVALYGRRHLLQLVAIKRRQAEGRSIADIQAELAGATDAALEGIARLPGDPPAGSAAPPQARPRFWAERPAAPDVPSRPTQPVAPDPLPHPAPAVVGDPLHAPPVAPGPPPHHTPAIAPAPPVAPDPVPRLAPPAQPAVPDMPPSPARAFPARAAGGVAEQAAAAVSYAAAAHLDGLLHGVRLAPGVTLLLDGHTPTPADVAAVREAAAPLLALLRERRLCAPSPADGRTRPAAGPDQFPSEGIEP